MSADLASASSIAVAQVEKERAIGLQDPAHFPEDFDEVLYVETRTRLEAEFSSPGSAIPARI